MLLCLWNTTWAAAQAYCRLHANYQQAKPVISIKRFIPTCQIKHTSDRYVKRRLITQSVPITVAIVMSYGYTNQFAVVVICSVLICCVFVLITACGLLEKPVGRLNKSFQKTWTMPAKTACRGIETGRRRWNHKLALAPNRVLNLIIHLLFILLASSQYQSLARGRWSRCFVTRGVTLNGCQWSWSHRLNQQIQGWLMFTERLDLSRSVLLKRRFAGALQIFFGGFFQKWSQGDTLGLTSDSLSTQDILPHWHWASRWPDIKQDTKLRPVSQPLMLEKCGYVGHNLAVVHVIGQPLTCQPITQHPSVFNWSYCN